MAARTGSLASPPWPWQLKKSKICPKKSPKPGAHRMYLQGEDSPEFDFSRVTLYIVTTIMKQPKTKKQWKKPATKTIAISLESTAYSATA
jgi:hypothetical protein